MIKTICIVGGGSSGWAAAAYLSQNTPVNILLVESTKLGTIGVGEGTQPYTMPFLQACGLEPEDWMKAADATYKYGVEFTGWSDDPVFVDNDTQEMAVLGPGVMYHDYWLSRDGVSRKDHSAEMPSYILGKANKSPKMGDPRLDFTPGFINDTWDAVHFNATALAELLRDKFKDKISYLDDVIIEAPSDDNGITHLVTENNGNIEADLYIDCSGFRSLLLEESLGVNFNPINDVLLCDKAIAMTKQYDSNEEEAMHPYTKTIAMDAGWRWVIPTYSRIGNGYVYSSKHITPEQAEKDLRDAIGEYVADAVHIDIKTGTHDVVAHKNVYAIGLAAGFVEPLEATGITLSTKALELLVNALTKSDGIWNDDVRGFLNFEYDTMTQEIIDFVFLHYHFAQKNDTPFWNDVHNIPVHDSAQTVIDLFLPHPPEMVTMRPYFSMFHVGQWFEMLYGFGAYDGIKGNASEDVMKYGDWVRDIYNYRTNKLLELMPNHYEYLKRLYDDEEDIQPTPQPKVKSESI